MDDLISRQALCEYALNQKDKSITPNDIMRFPSAQPEERTEERTETHACDYISRQAAIDVLGKIFPADPMRNDYTKGITCGAALATEYIKQLPSAQQRWIPCSERLPEDGENVLVTYKTTDKIHLCQYHDDGSRNPWYSYIDQCRAHMNVVLAWMPLAEPARLEGE